MDAILRVQARWSEPYLLYGERHIAQCDNEVRHFVNPIDLAHGLLRRLPVRRHLCFAHAECA